jgi:hypothetical protein
LRKNPDSAGPGLDFETRDPRGARRLLQTSYEPCQGTTFSRAVKIAARSAYLGSVASVCQFLARDRDRTPAFRPKISRNLPNSQMWKVCQEATPKSKVITSHSTPLTSFYPQSARPISDS